MSRPFTTGDQGVCAKICEMDQQELARKGG